MRSPSPKLYDRKRIILILVSIAVGVVFGLFRLKHETGRIGAVEVGASLAALVVALVIAYVVVRWANRPE